MASATAMRAMRRPLVPLATQLAQAAPVFTTAFFSTRSLVAAAAAAAIPPPPVLRNRKGLPKKLKTSYKKKTNIVTGKKPAPGERKAFRKRIQLSNNNALPVAGLDELAPGTMATSESRGRVFALPDQLVDQLRALEAFKPTQSWNLFRRPHFLIREETVDLTAKMNDCKEKKDTLRCVLTGSRLSGKSLIQMQALSHALLNDWLVIHIPEAQDLTNGNTEYSPIPETEPMQFSQPVYCLKLLQNIYKANLPLLEKLPLSQDWSKKISHSAQGAATLADLVQGAKESDSAWPTLHALWTEILQPGRPPVLFTLDGLAQINKLSEYRDPSYRKVHAHDLTLVRLFIDALSGKTHLPNGGAVLAANSENNTHRHPSQTLVLAQLEAGQKGQEGPMPDPYERNYDERVYEALKTCHLVQVEGISKEDAAALMEYWGASGMMRTVVDSRTIAEKWALGGHGIVGEMERAALLTMRM